MIARPASCFALMLAASPAPALAAEDGQIWTSFTASGPVSGDFALWADVQLRFGDDASRLTQSVYRLGAGYAPSADVAFYAGYARSISHRENGPDQLENRLWQQAGYPLGRFGNVQLSGRTRIEQRMVEGADDTGWRLRQQVKVMVPIARDGRIRFAASAELLYNLDSTDWGARAGMDQFRSFVGVNLPLRPGLAVEFGYLNQIQSRSGGPDQMNHIAQAAFSYRFGR
jgi:hypothetical protein